MVDTPDQRLARFAAQHHGLYRSEDARRLGLTDRQVAIRVRQGRATRIGFGLFRASGVPGSRDQDLLLATWRSHGVTSHRSAAELQDLLPGSRINPEVTADARSAHEFPGVIVHRSTDLTASGITVVRGIPTTTPTRTLVDLGAVVGPKRLESAVHRALHRGLTTIERLTTEYYRISRRGRSGAGPIGTVLREMDPLMGPAESDLELVMLRVLDQHGLPAPVRQHPVSVEGHRFRLDLAYPELRLLLEGDGFGVHGVRHAFEDDRWRQNLLVLAGWWPMRFTWRQLRGDPSACADQVRRMIDHLGGRISGD